MIYSAWTEWCVSLMHFVDCSRPAFNAFLLLIEVRVRRSRSVKGGSFKKMRGIKDGKQSTKFGMQVFFLTSQGEDTRVACWWPVASKNEVKEDAAISSVLSFCAPRWSIHWFFFLFYRMMKCLGRAWWGRWCDGAQNHPNVPINVGVPVWFMMELKCWP